MNSTNTMNTTRICSALLAVVAIAFTSCKGFSLQNQSEVRIKTLRCESLVNPRGIDEREPRLSWILESAQRGQRQTASQILMASSRERLQRNEGDLWDSGRRDSSASIQVSYAGKPLTSRQQCFWKVRVWDKDGKASAWSEPANFSVGLLARSDWQAHWIGHDETSTNTNESRRLPARMLRKEFAATKPVARATIYFSGLGLSELFINGDKIGDQVLSPGLTEYSNRVHYLTFDVTAQIRRGQNAIGAWLGNGRYYAPRANSPAPTLNYGFPKLLAQLEINYTDGSRDVIVSDESWKLTTDGPITANNEYDGEEYDARREMPGWNRIGFKDGDWQSAKTVSAPVGALRAEMIEPIRVTETLKPVKLTEPSPGVFVYDFGQNFVGWCRLAVRGPVGTTVKLRFAETLNTNGTLYTANLRDAKVTDLYTLSGTGEEIYEPRFTYHGFRYAEITGFPGRPTKDSLIGKVVHDDVASAGSFECSNPLINRIHENVRWGTRGNYRSLSTDCPQRDERQGWLGDRSAFARGETYQFDIAALYSKWVQDFEDSQKPSGSMSDVCPPYWPIYSDNVTWPASTIIIPGALLDQYSDTRLIARHYPSMVKWIEYMGGFITNGIIEKDSYGDWCVPPESPELIHSKDSARKTNPAILATSYFTHCLNLLSRYATLLEKPDDAKRFTTWATQMKTALNEKYYNREKGYYDNGTQTACVLPLAFDLVPDGERPRVFKQLVHKIEGESRGHVGTGLIGGQWLNRVLTAGGRPDLVYRFATNTAYPSWGYMVENGATTVWELWNGNTADPAMNSGNHVMLVGDLSLWLYEDLAGIKADPTQPGLKHILMKPNLVGDLKWAKATHESPYGRIASHWQRAGDTLDWRIIVPPNSTATVWVPARNAESVRESGHPVAAATGVEFLRMESGRAVYRVHPGSYRFVSRPG